MRLCFFFLFFFFFLSFFRLFQKHTVFYFFSPTPTVSTNRFRRGLPIPLPILPIVPLLGAVITPGGDDMIINVEFLCTAGGLVPFTRRRLFFFHLRARITARIKV